MTELTLDWHPTILHDLHEAQTYLYTSTGTGPYNDALDPITVSEWWMLAENDVLEMTKRGVPGVWTYGFYDGWVPNYMIFIAHSHNAIGRFYEVQSYGPDNTEVRPGANVLSKEWFRPNPPLPYIKWGPRNNTNIQQSAVLFSLNHVAKNRQHYLENYWLKNKRSVDKGKTGAVNAWLIPAGQRRKADAATAVNDLRRQGLEISRAGRDVQSRRHRREGGRLRRAGDQPFRTLADMYFSIQNYAPQNPSPYDDTGWTFQLMRDMRIIPIDEKSVLDQPMTLVTTDVKATGGIEGTGRVLVVEHTADNIARDVPFQERRRSRCSRPRRISNSPAGSSAPDRSSCPTRDRARLEPMLRDLGLSAWAVARRRRSRRTISTCRASATCTAGAARRTKAGGVPRSTPTACPYTYFADQKLREGQPAIEVRRHPLSARRRHCRLAGERHGTHGQYAAPVQEDGRHAEPRGARFERRHSRRHGSRGPGRAREVRAARAARSSPRDRRRRSFRSTASRAT